VEVWDWLDETCLLSAEGRMDLTDHPHTLRLDGAVRIEVVGPTFSAASRDPVQRRFASIDDYFRRGPEGAVEEGIGVRVYVRDERRGRQALLWDVSWEEKVECEVVTPGDLMWARVPEGSRRVRYVDTAPIYSPALPGHAPHARMELLVGPMPGQEGVAEADKLWRVVGGDEQHDPAEFVSGFSMKFSDDVKMSHHPVDKGVARAGMILELLRGL
jgi:hypothetical protein